MAQNVAHCSPLFVNRCIIFLPAFTPTPSDLGLAIDDTTSNRSDWVPLLVTTYGYDDVIPVDTSHPVNWIR